MLKGLWSTIFAGSCAEVKQGLCGGTVQSRIKTLCFAERKFTSPHVYSSRDSG